MVARTEEEEVEVEEEVEEEREESPEAGDKGDLMHPGGRRRGEDPMVMEEDKGSDEGMRLASAAGARSLMMTGRRVGGFGSMDALLSVSSSEGNGDGDGNTNQSILGHQVSPLVRPLAPMAI